MACPDLECIGLETMESLLDSRYKTSQCSRVFMDDERHRFNYMQERNVEHDKS